MAKENGSDSQCRDYAEAICLCTVTHFEDLVRGKGLLPEPNPDPELVSRRVEEACGLAPSRYFYAGRLHADFGNIGFVYSSEVECDQTGTANPFDTGGAFCGHVTPFREIADAKEREGRACILIDATLSDLFDWREHFAEYLIEFFPNPRDYAAESPVPSFENSGNRFPDDTPVRHARNFDTGDFRYCSWEIRIQGPISQTEHLKRWGCDQPSHEMILQRVLDDPDDPLAALARTQPAVVDDPVRLCRRLEEPSDEQ